MKLLFSFLILFVSLICVGQPEVLINNRSELAYKDILSLKFDHANELLTVEKTENPHNLYVEYLGNYIDFLSVFISEDELLFNRLEDNKSTRIDLIKKLDDDSPYRNYLLGNIYLQWAVARLKFQEYFTAAFEINKAYRLLKLNKERYPDFVPNNITLGVLHIMIGLVPDKFHWLLEIINMEGSVQLGKEELKFVLKNTMEHEEYAYLKNEVLFYLGFVELNIYPDESELSFLLKQLETEEKDNLMLSYLTINILMRTGNNDEVLQKFNQLPDLQTYFPFYYLNYLEGECRLRKLDIQHAEDRYKLFLENFTGQNFIKDAYRKLAWSALISNDTIRYQELMAKVTDHGQNNVGQDADAEREANDNYIPNTALVKSRLLFDGGYYQKADSVLNSITTTTLTAIEFTELEYRMARIADQLHQLEAAKTLYRKTIESGKDSPRYFAGNSALKLGEIYEAEADYDQAIYYYDLCLDLNFDEYESGIHSKAKAGLKRVSN